MRRLLPALLALVALALPVSPAFADDGLRWRRTTPRATLERVEGALFLTVPSGRAWGLESRGVRIEPGETYLARVALDVEGGDGGVAFLRLAFYASPDGRGRQRRRIDSVPVLPGESAEREVEFTAPNWARAVKLRVLVRRLEFLRGAVAVRGPELAPAGPRLPEVILREVE